jgi:hypothetical protein
VEYRPPVAAGIGSREREIGDTMKAAFLFGVGAVLAGAMFGCSSSSNPASVPQEAGAPPITGLTQGQWSWVPVDGDFCRDGSATGIGVNPGKSTDKLMIFLEGGGACYDETTCALMNPSKFDSSDFTSFAGAEGKLGIFDRTQTTNPVSDWTFVYVPYCTGDIHAGNNVASADAGPSVASQHFVGYNNVTLDLARLVPTFPGLTKVLLTGISAGGFGAAVNYAQTARAFGTVPVVLLDDSGPPLESPYTATCQQQIITELWGLDKTVLADCGSDCSNPSTLYIDAAKHIGKEYPNAPFGLVESTDDFVITTYFGLGTDEGANDCKGIPIVSAETGPVFTEGLQDIRTKLASNPKFGSFYFDGTDHTSLLTNFSDTDARTSDGVKLTDWVAQLINGTVSNVGLTGSDTDGGTDAGTPAGGDAGTDAGATPGADASLDGAVVLGI